MPVDSRLQLHYGKLIMNGRPRDDDDLLLALLAGVVLVYRWNRCRVQQAQNRPTSGPAASFGLDQIKRIRFYGV